MKPQIGQSGVKNKPYIVVKAGYIELSNGDKMYIPKYYAFDNASIPKWAKWIYDITGWEFFDYQEYSFLVHDFLYNFSGYMTEDKWKIKPISRKFADDELAYQMLENGNTANKISTYWLAVRLFGWLFFGKI